MQKLPTAYLRLITGGTSPPANATPPSPPPLIWDPEAAGTTIFNPQPAETFPG